MIWNEPDSVLNDLSEVDEIKLRINTMNELEDLSKLYAHQFEICQWAKTMIERDEDLDVVKNFVDENWHWTQDSVFSK